MAIAECNKIKSFEMENKIKKNMKKNQKNKKIKKKNKEMPVFVLVEYKDVIGIFGKVFTNVNETILNWKEM